MSIPFTPAQSPCDWHSPATEVLLNPRLPDAQRAILLEAQATLPTLPAHVWLTTSGSSGVKWVALSKNALLASAAAVNTLLQSDAGDTWALALPPFHVGGLGVLARGALSGAAVYAYADALGEPRWNAASFAEFLAQTRATLTTLVPTQLHDLVQAGLPAPPDMRAIVVGGGALSPALYHSARTLGWPVLPSYGLSECCSQVATAALSSLDNATDGEPPLMLLPHVAARIGSDGRIALRSASLLTGYGLLEGAKARFVDPKEDGWFRTEDTGTLHGNVLAMAGRIGDFVKIGGESADMARLQLAWESLLPPALHAKAVLVAVPDNRLGAAVHVAAAANAALDMPLERAVAEFNSLVLPYERVRRVQRVEALPRSPLGKLLRAELLRLLAQDGG